VANQAWETKVSRPPSSRRGYDKAWEKLSKRVRTRAVELGLPCRMCGKHFVEGDFIEVDHIQEIRDAPHLRLVLENLEPLHHDCHVKKTHAVAKVRRNGYSGSVDSSGLPLDPRHPWNTDE
jgi:5-methylcytosine-specific restriction endonuclease McrA